MPTAPRRNRTAAEVRSQILEAATELLAGRSPADVTLRQIAERAGVQHSLIIRHFGSKAGLVQAVLAETAAGYARSVVAADDPADGFVRALGHLLDHPLAAAAFASVQLTADEPGGGQRAYPGADLHRALLVEAAGPASRDVRVVAAVGLALVAGWAALEPWARVAFDLTDVPVGDLRAEVAEVLRDLITRQADLG